MLDKYIPRPSRTLEKERNDLETALKEVEVVGDGKLDVPSERLGSVASLRAIHSKAHRDDAQRSTDRAKVQAMIDYLPPYDQGKLNTLGRSHQFNVNFGEGSSIINESVNGYVDIFTAPSTLITLPVKHDMGTETEMAEWSAIVSEEFTRMVRSWDEAQFRFLQLANTFVTHGVGFGMFADKDNWQWHVSGMNEVKLPPRTKATSSSIEVLTSERLMSAHELYGYIRTADDNSGWNKDAVLWAIANNKAGNTDMFDVDNPEDIQERIKAHDFDTGADIAPIRIIQGLVKEYDGTVSQYLILKTPAGNDADDAKSHKENSEYLFRKQGAYSSMKEAVHVFPYFTGNNGNIHTIRGLGQIVYPQVQASNMMQCSMLDSARDAMTTTYVTPEGKNIDRLPIIYAGSARLIPPTLQVSEQQHKPDLSRSAVPAMSLLRDQITRMSSSAAMTKVLNEGQDRRSKFEVNAAIEYFSAINAAAMRLFFKPWREMLVESSKRSFKKAIKAGTSWGDAAKRMQQRCLDRGVPENILYMGLDFEEAMVDLPLGLGNKAAREAIFTKGTELLPWMDDSGRRRYAAERAIDLFGVEKADAFVSLKNVERPPIDVKIAQLENNQLMQGMQVFVDQGENTIIHLREHISYMWKYHQAYEEGNMELIDVVQKIKPIYDHAVETFQTAQVPQDQRAEIANAKQSLQQLEEIIANGIKAIQKQQRLAAEAQEREQQSQPQEQGSEQQAQPADKDQQARTIKAQAEAEIKIKMAELERQLIIQKEQLKASIEKEKAKTKQITDLQESAAKRAAAESRSSGVINRSPQ